MNDGRVFATADCELPAPLDTLPLAPLPDDGEPVIRMSVNVYEYEDPDGRQVAVHVYGLPTEPLGHYVSILQRSETRGVDISVDPRLLAVWERTGLRRPDYRYHPLEPADEAAALAWFAALDRPALAVAWVHWKEIREVRDGGAVLRLVSTAVDYTAEDDFEFYEYDDEGRLTPLAFLTHDQLDRFTTIEERERSAKRTAEHSAELLDDAARGVLPF
jgi:hypothetical protein